MKYKVGFVSLGCPKNLTDTETMIGLLKDEYEIETNPEKADIIVINTCGFIESAKQESINTIIEMGEYKNSGNLKKLVVTGCLAQRYSEEILSQLPEVDVVVGTASFVDIKKAVKSAFNGGENCFLRDIDEPAEENLPRVLATAPGSAYLKIADGCNNKCTYCIIPKLRGKYRSRTVESIVDEAKELVLRGVGEIILVAQDTTFYGVDIYEKKMLPTLLRELTKIEKLRWIRVHYCYPELIDDELIDAFKSIKKVCKYIDIPFQHAANDVLKRMARRSTFEKNCDLIKKLRREIDGICIRSTFITGFPGETEDDFEKLKEFVKFAKIDKLGVFAFSPEEGTAAFDMENQIDDNIKEARRDEIMKIQSGISKELECEKIGKTIDVLCQQKIKDGLFFGRSEYDSPEVDGGVYFSAGEDIAPGSFVRVKINKAFNYDLEGDFIEYCK